ncbi:MAG: bifunctional folylpolyglutamate synthase/dihydrofolate synthase [Gammaproteobacteria bacterium]
MTRNNLSDWLTWQEQLNPAEIELGLDRVRSIADNLALHAPPGRVITVAGTNGKGSTVAAIEGLLRAGGLRTGLYSSPHLVRYNERICVAGKPVADSQLVAAFEAIEAVRGGTALTFFEYGTLAALLIFSEQHCDAWILEVGLGGRLDAVNMVDPDVAVITTVDLDHQEWLGDTVEAIAGEKAGIMRPGKPALFGDQPVPEAIEKRAAEISAPLFVFKKDFDGLANSTGWQWCGRKLRLDKLPLPVSGGEAQIRNQTLALAAVECLEPGLVQVTEIVREVLKNSLPPGRCQVHIDTHEWVLDVAHNLQAAQQLHSCLTTFELLPTIFIVGMLADKNAGEFCACLDDLADHWLCCPTESGRGSGAEQLADKLRGIASGGVTAENSVAEAMAAARKRLPEGGRVVVCGSFQIVGPALEQLGLY